MNIAILHYHLKTGGVTTVIRHQLEALRGRCNVLVVSGSPPGEAFPADVAVVPEIGYDRPGVPHADPVRVAEKIAAILKTAWPDGCDVLHVHNPTLAKNRQFLNVLRNLQQRGERLFLQIHDFAEDGRPAAYYEEDYPVDCHYGVINSRDYEFLIQAGLSPDGLHMLPNTISPLSVRPGKKIWDDYVLYPVRAIRRKNIGEAILLSLTLGEGIRLAITLPPNSAADIGSYNGWRRFTRKHRLNVHYEASSAHDFLELVNGARFLLTTSITEGFGFSFLEPWTAGKVLWGRLLEDICRDFFDHGIDLDDLYREIRVPLAWIGPTAFCQKWSACLRQNADQYRFPLADARIADFYETITQGDDIDFSLLDESSQKQVIERILDSRGDRRTLISINPWLDIQGQCAAGSKVAANRDAILEHYNPERYRNNLMSIYHRVSGHRVVQGIDKRRLFLSFFSPRRLSLLKWSPYVE